ncbi:hypothetical protein BpHYR1_035213 [Brachionus plicatilis]|uniref:Uncharacterized protein n=1 Tax=Brachionus plicatilis TaxID=10195 RepID=A0A3M7T9W2_BRAPC|nr:hypothetical protein BpHYR1_035213 [Brachionus plicatilis]
MDHRLKIILVRIECLNDTTAFEVCGFSIKSQTFFLTSGQQHPKFSSIILSRKSSSSLRISSITSSFL